jgi:hypothetical protein
MVSSSAGRLPTVVVVSPALETVAADAVVLVLSLAGEVVAIV